MTLDAPLDGQFGSLHLTGGRADFTLKHADRILLSDLPAGTGYTVTELDADQDGYVTSSTGAAGTIRAEQVHEALFRNVKDLPEPPPLPTGSLVIRKTVSGTAGEPDRPFHFKILLNSPLEGQFGSLHLTGGSADFTLKHGGSVLLTDLPAGTVYTVTELEADQDGYVTGSTGATGTIRADEIGEVSFRNVKDQPESEPLPTGSLVIRKTVSGTAGEPDRLFHFSITLDAPLEGQFGSLQLTGGTGDFTLKHGGSVLLTGLPAGTVYTVTELEADQDGYVTGSTGAVGTIRADELGEVSFRNVKDQPESEPLPTGSLVIRKTVSGTAGEPDRLFHFTIVLNAPLEGQFGNLQLTGGTGDFTLKHGDSIFLSGLPAGTVYTVTEQEGDQDGYRTESTGATGQIIAGEITEVSFLNVRDPVEPSPIPTGSLTIRKTVSGTGGDRERQFRFRVTLDRPLEGPYGEVIFSAGRAEFSLKHGEQISARDLPAGLNFNVEELDADSDGYITSSTGALGTIQENRTAEALFLNHKSASTPPEPRGSLVVRKILIGAGSGRDESFEFRMELDDPTIEGVYGGMNFHQGTAEFTLRHQEALEATDLPANVHYQITERSSQGYEVQAYGDTGTIPEGGVAYATFFNLPAHSPAGSLTVTKKVSGDAGDADGIFHFTVTLKDRQIQGIFGEMIFTDGEAAFTLRGGETCVASGLPAGTEYTVTEQEANEAGCVTLEWGTAGTIPDSGSAFALFENIYQIPRGTLVIRKTVEGTRLDRETLFHFTLTLEDTSIEGRYGELLFHRGKASFALRHGQSVQATGLPAGIRYFVEEAKADQKGFLTETSGTEGTIGDGTESLASFTNIRKPTTLKVTKLVAGSREQLSNVFLFSIRLSDSSISGSFGDVTFTHGYGEFLLGHSESIYIHDLPEGISYTIREVLPSDPAPDQDVPLVVSKHASGVISSDDPVSVLFTNYYDQIDDLPEDPPNAPESPDHPSELPPEIPPETPPETPPEIPQNPVPLNPEVPHQPNLPVEPEIPDLTEPPYVPDIPDAPEVPYGPPLIPDIPQTGEPIGSRIFGLLMLASLLGLAALNLRGHRKPK